jgi:uncharacterized protein HemY
VINEERLEQFKGWLKAKGEDPRAVLALRWIAEFEEYVEEDEEALRQFKDWVKAKGDLLTLKVITEFEETVEDEERLKQFEDWLKAKGNDPNAWLTRWWIGEFEEAE